MSNTVINWRFWTYHLQVIRWRDWGLYLRDRRSPVTIGSNMAHAPGGSARGPGWQPVAFYEGKRYLLVLGALLLAATVF